MRKLLLASVAMLSGTLGLANVASAQLQTQYPYTPPAGSTPVPGPMGAGPFTGPESTITPYWGTLPPVSTGSLTVRLGGRLTTYIGAFADSGRDPGIIGQTGPDGAHPKGTATYGKLASYGVGEFARLYPSFDGVAANGLKYGAFLEVRQDNSVGPNGGGGIAGSTVSASTNARGALYFRRETGYIGTDQLGFIRVGATDQPTSLFITGTFENFDGLDGGWNFTDVPGQFTSKAIPSWPFPDQGSLYTTSKIVYVSPKFANLVDFGVSFEPNTGTVDAIGGSCAYASSTCDALSSSSTTSDLSRRRNTLDGVARVRTSVGPVGVAATVGGMYSGAVQYNGPDLPSTVQGYNGLAVFDSGLAATYGGLTVGGHVDYGQFNQSYSLQPTGGVNSLAWITGASYAFGSLIVGASWFNFQSPGYWNYAESDGVGRRLTQTGLATGGTLALAPGVWAFVSYLYGERHQAGVDLLAQDVGGYVSHNNTKAQGLTLGTTFKW